MAAARIDHWQRWPIGQRRSRLGGAWQDGCGAVIGSWAAMVGAVIIARAIDGPALSDEVLEQTRAWIDAGISRMSST